MLRITVHLLLDVPDDGASCFDAVNEILRGHQRTFAPDSCLIDYAINNETTTVTLDPATYEEGAGFE